MSLLNLATRQGTANELSSILSRAKHGLQSLSTINTELRNLGVKLQADLQSASPAHEATDVIDCLRVQYDVIIDSLDAIYKALPDFGPLFTYEEQQLFLALKAKAIANKP